MENEGDCSVNEANLMSDSDLAHLTWLTWLALVDLADPTLLGA